jgi:predicted RNA-binding Zn-ribbon protein involved in translation (DUF1610 family)
MRMLMTECSSGKTGHIDQIAATFAMETARNRRRNRSAKVESRIYLCPECGKYHVTSSADARMRRDYREM